MVRLTAWPKADAQPTMTSQVTAEPFLTCDHRKSPRRCPIRSLPSGSPLGLDLPQKLRATPNPPCRRTRRTTRPQRPRSPPLTSRLTPSRCQRCRLRQKPAPRRHDPASSPPPRQHRQNRLRPDLCRVWAAQQDHAPIDGTNPHFEELAANAAATGMSVVDYCAAVPPDRCDQERAPAQAPAAAPTTTSTSMSPPDKPDKPTSRIITDERFQSRQGRIGVVEETDIS